MNRSLLALTACAALLAPVAALAVPLTVAHQGVVQDADGPVTGTLEFVFALYDADSGGNEVWSETRNVDVVDGNYTVLLGSVTAIDSVLFVEPALWLQITVEGGDPLLPRQPVASAPYAVVANTAVNVDGGTVNASSVSVNGTTVVDGTGSWVGGAGSVDWSAIDGVPIDADTLAGLGLSCADGDRAVWNDGLGQWECGSATVALDRLDIASATAGDVLSFDGNDAAWSDAVAAGGCGLSVVSDLVSELTCGTTTVRVKTTEEYIAVGGPSDNIRLRADGSLSVVGTYTGASPPTGPFIGLSRGSDDYYCAIVSGGTLVCQSFYSSSAAPGPAGTYSDVSCAANFCCAVNTSGAASCWDTYTYNGPYAPNPTGSGFAQIVANDSGACARTGGGTVACWNSTDPQASDDLVANMPLLSNVDQLLVRGNLFQAVTAWGDVTVWDHQSTQWSASIPPGNYVASSREFFFRDDGLAVGAGSVSSVQYLQGSYIAGGTNALVRSDGTLSSGGASALAE